MRELRVCTNCVMDTTDSAITFDAQGVCDHCRTFRTKIQPNWHTDERGERAMREMVQRIKAGGQGKDFDCIIGMSGGIDSSYLTYYGPPRKHVSLHSVQVRGDDTVCRRQADTEEVKAR